MDDQKNLWVCTHNLRPRVNGVCVTPIKKGTPFDPDGILTAETKAFYIERGELTKFVPTLKDPIDVEARDIPEKKVNAPQGIFNMSASDLEGMELDDLNALHAEICSSHGLKASDPFKTIKQAIKKLTSEA